LSEQSNDPIGAHLKQSLAALERTHGDAPLLANARKIAAVMIAALRAGNKILLIGNGGSAADAQHIAAEIIGRYKQDRPGYAALALTTDTSALTSIGNDYGFDKVFERQVRALGRNGDVFIGISTSGRSPNVVAALQAARELGLTTIGFTRHAQTAMHALCDLTLGVPAEETALIQQIHITAGHAICHLVEHELFGAKSGTKRS